jgi:hypothetical protein
MSAAKDKLIALTHEKFTLQPPPLRTKLCHDVEQQQNQQSPFFFCLLSRSVFRIAPELSTAARIIHYLQMAAYDLTRPPLERHTYLHDPAIVRRWLAGRSSEPRSYTYILQPQWVVGQN